MKIVSTTAGVTGQGAAQAGDAGRAKAAGDAAPGTTAAGSAGVKLSPMSAKLQSIASGLAGPEFDRAKVDEIKQAMRDGKLAIRTDVVADRMIEDVKDRIGRGSR